jgi:hypothetical protein
MEAVGEVPSLPARHAVPGHKRNADRVRSRATRCPALFQHAQDHIYGGSTEIQKNIVSKKMVLGL